jgi:hypothetical protein
MNTYIPAPGTSVQNGEVSLFVSSTYLAANLSFGQIGSSGNPVSLPSGSHNVYASLINSNSVLSEAAAVNFSGNNTPYTIISAGESGQSGALAPQVIVMQDYTSGALSLGAGQCAIRVVNLSLNPNPIGLFGLSAGKPTSALAPAVASLGFGYNPTSNPYVAINAPAVGTVTLVDTTAPTVSLPITNSNAVSNLDTLGFVAGSAYTLVIYGQVGNAATYNQLGATWIQDYPVP